MFAECCVFNKQLQRPGIFDRSQLTEQVLHQNRRTFSRSYGAILPSSFTRVLSSALEFSSCPPVSVWGTVFYQLCLEAFLGSWASIPSSPWGLPITPQGHGIPDLPGMPPYTLGPAIPAAGGPSLLRPPFALIEGTGILTCFPSTTPFGLALGAD